MARASLVQDRPWSQLGFFGAWLFATSVGIVLQPSHAGHGTHQLLGLPPCPSVLLFDRPCPGCGMTTSWCALLHGDWGLAVHANPFGPVFYAVFTFAAMAALIGFAQGRRVDMGSPRISRISGWVVGAFIVFGLARFALSPHYGTSTERMIAGISASSR
ncbi:MAG: DUF2752 domain-containing protein [Fimbriimonas ginsengisoli]|uniref:DUF2752 domain-containing protein n=1 Tax=Fimbriimonas ginsengisoli TaxID=1005039 RepID=A0A931LUN7_FIMGI|nr:DUF2752 domain-containing protein [Fimbriimonas ginsengisoli]MBI3721750.1 DUF2752 domain-containing protein [Fimbriimonas ginsengisoli]